MRITERQARLRVRAAVEVAGTQMTFARTLRGITEKAAQTAVSRAVVTQEPIHWAILAALGLRRDSAGDIDAPDKPRPVAAPFVDIDHVTDADGVTRRLSSAVRVF